MIDGKKVGAVLSLGDAMHREMLAALMRADVLVVAGREDAVVLPRVDESVLVDAFMARVEPDRVLTREPLPFVNIQAALMVNDDGPRNRAERRALEKRMRRGGR